MKFHKRDAAELFESHIQEIFEELPEQEKAEVNGALDVLINEVKRGHPRVQFSKTSMLLAVIATMYYLEYSESGATTILRRSMG